MTAEAQSTQSTAGPRVVRVREGMIRRPPAPRTFCVVLDRTPSDEEMAAVATARDPKGGAAIPAAGSPHPLDDRHVARPPMIHCVGRRDVASGEMLASRSRFFNVRVPYAMRSEP
ncbi:MAG TPA: hypothetical protein VMW52_09405 [Phycisphaerae bacterium]|nr:hypothetical protein [Phycisphaerae bacterium]